MGAGASALDPNQPDDDVEGKGQENDGGDGTYDPLQAQAAAHWRRVLLHARTQLEERKRAEEDGVTHALADNHIVEEESQERETQRDVVRVSAIPSRLINSNEDPSSTSISPVNIIAPPLRATTAPIESPSSMKSPTLAPRGPPPVRYIGQPVKRPLVNGQPVQPPPPLRPSPPKSLAGGGGGDSIHNASFATSQSVQLLFAGSKALHSQATGVPRNTGDHSVSASQGSSIAGRPSDPRSANSPYTISPSFVTRPGDSNSSSNNSNSISSATGSSSDIRSGLNKNIINSNNNRLVKNSDNGNGLTGQSDPFSDKDNINETGPRRIMAVRQIQAAAAAPLAVQV